MENRIDPVAICSASDRNQFSVEVGEHFQLIGPDLLVDKGDEYCDSEGCFVPFPLEAIARPVPSGLLARRPLFACSRPRVVALRQRLR